jgi:hypothetical protein
MHAAGLIRQCRGAAAARLSKLRAGESLDAGHYNAVSCLGGVLECVDIANLQRIALSLHDTLIVDLSLRAIGGCTARISSRPRSRVLGKVVADWPARD